MEITINKDELYSLIKEAVREVLQEESMDFFPEKYTLCIKRRDGRY